jgi:uncharacterized damage-inducible protein DinB
MGSVTTVPRVASDRGRLLAAGVRAAATRLADIVDTVSEQRWHHVPAAGVWSIGKDAEHVVEAAAYHDWIVRLTIGEPVSSRRPALERKHTTTNLSPRRASALLRERAEASARLIADLTDAQLDLPTKPRRAKAATLGATIERVLIGHYDAHVAAIEAKLTAPRLAVRPGALS